MKEGTISAITAIGALTAIESLALLQNVDGVMLSLVVAAIAGLGGFEVKKIISR